MAKRFTDTEKWKKPFIRGLQGAYKLLWLYICDDCDHAGIWQVDIEVAAIRIGEKIDSKEAIKSFDEKIIIFDKGNKWFIPSFLEFQYPSGLNPDNRAHNSVIILLEKYNLRISNNKPLISPSEGSMDMDMDKDMVKDMLKEKKKNTNKTYNKHKQLNEEIMKKRIPRRKLRNFIEDKGIKKGEIANALGISQQRFSTKSRRNGVMLSVATISICSISKLFNCSKYWSGVLA